jgi:hypothetical protein
MKIKAEIKNVSQGRFEMMTKEGLFTLKPDAVGVAILPKATLDAAVKAGTVTVKVLEELGE